MGDLWGSFIPSWIEAIATLLALVAAAVAAFYAWRTFRREAERDELAVASAIAAWWVTYQDGGKAHWAVVVQNSGIGVFHDVALDVEGNGNANGGKHITVRMLPPGTFFVESLSYGSAKAWSSKQVVDPTVEMTPLTDATRWSVKRINFRDAHARSWQWTPEDGYRHARPPRS